jgi:hypothetical protein
MTAWRDTQVPPYGLRYGEFSKRGNNLLKNNKKYLTDDVYRDRIAAQERSGSL